jgi:hypothetical protein
VIAFVSEVILTCGAALISDLFSVSQRINKGLFVTDFSFRLPSK